MAYVTLGVFLVVVAVGASAALVWAMSGQLLRPRRMTDGLAMAYVGRVSPEDLGMPYTPTDFTVRSHAGPLRLAGWWIPAAVPSDRTAVLLHGYADAKTGAIAWAPMWREMGWHVLAIDLRAHGHSDGRDVTAGFYERDDLDQVLDALRAEKPAQARHVALFGVSLGAAVAAACAARRDDLAAVVLESPYTDYRTAIAAHGTRRGMPLVRAFGLVATLAEWRSGADFGAVRPIDLVTQIAAPLLVIHGDMDLFVSPESVAAYAKALAGRTGLTEHAVLPNVQHVLGLAVDPAGYAALVRRFVDRATDQAFAPQRDARDLVS